MKIIDLLNKIANGEEVKAHHEYFDIDYCNDKDFTIGYKTNFNHNEPLTLFHIIKLLNTNVEIIEEDKKLEKLKVEYAPDIEEKIFWENGDKPNHCILGDAGTELLINKINEIIDVINKEKE